MNVDLMHPKSKLIELGKQYRGTWLLAGLDLLIVLAVWAAAAYTPGAPKPATASEPVPSRLITAVNAESVRAHPNLRPALRPIGTVASRHGAACDAQPAGCGGSLHAPVSDPPMACQPVSHAAQHRDGDMGNPNPCPDMR